jgi:hypothetical protein
MDDIEEDAAFHKAIGDCKNVVTNFFIFKKESWLPTHLHNVKGIRHYSDVGKFAKGRGAIHTHGTGYSNTAADQEIDNFLVKLAIDSYLALKEIDEIIYDHLEPEDRLPSRDNEEPTSPLEIVEKEGMDA